LIYFKTVLKYEEYPFINCKVKANYRKNQTKSFIWPSRSRSLMNEGHNILSQLKGLVRRIIVSKYEYNLFINDNVWSMKTIQAGLTGWCTQNRFWTQKSIHLVVSDLFPGQISIIPKLGKGKSQFFFTAHPPNEI
jgi:hypothetical protein